MNPQSLSKPVMDVSAPRPVQQSTAPASDTIAVQPAPLSLESAKPAALSSAIAHQLPLVERPKSGAPVGVITIAVLVMMLLSAAAVIVYVTSQTA